MNPNLCWLPGPAETGNQTYDFVDGDYYLVAVQVGAKLDYTLVYAEGPTMQLVGVEDDWDWKWQDVSWFTHLPGLE